MDARLTGTRVIGVVALGGGLLLGWMVAAAPVLDRARADPCLALADGSAMWPLSSGLALLLGYLLMSAALLFVWRRRDRHQGTKAERGDPEAYLLVIALVVVGAVITVMFAANPTAPLLITLSCAI